ncbi:Phage lysin, phage lysozyme or muramidase [Hyphomicrobium sulfonivorans]|uniref:Lysozyme n=1 Tax=Hyphomicrobium sulfonivorans TaxID=121290 RepID=A0A109BL19_HYPSL|nr:lysozyme [Hyphomicrobium sulfonivorans]KWT70781.1 Phage lysin, phage lysozyme or muramidase [Hyphomicrobium sulfonivorans]
MPLSDTRVPDAPGRLSLSDEGLRLIKSFEGYHTRLKNGNCVAYLCPAGVPTIGYGCTEGVTLGMEWTEAEAEAALRRELDKIESGVHDLVAVGINQNQYDALVSFAYNCGVGGLAGSTVLKRVNAGQFDKVPAALDAWNKGGGKVLPGLVARRQREGALFMKPVEAPEAPFMPQAIGETVPLYRQWWVRLLAPPTVGTALISPDTFTAPPTELVDFIASLDAWKAVADAVVVHAATAIANPVQTAIVGVLMGAFIWFPQLKSYLPAITWRPQ